MKKLLNEKQKLEWATFLVRLSMELRKNVEIKSVVVNGRYRLVA